MQLLDALRAEKEKLGRQMASIDRTIQELSGEATKKVKKFSAATRAKMAKSRKAFWAKKKAAEKKG
jgi:hypothetical protein